MTEENNKNMLPSYSLAERHFYLMLVQCESCGKGPFELVSQEQSPDGKIDTWNIRCKQCSAEKRILFDAGTLLIKSSPNHSAPIPIVNPTRKPSKLIDAGQWLAIFYAILSSASEQTEKKDAQRLGYEATLAIDEALKFYEDDSDLPPERAIWTPSSRQRFQEHPEYFDRHRILQMRGKLPSLRAMQNSIERKEEKQPWWKKIF